MRHPVLAAATALLLLTGAAASAAERTVRLTVDNMSCAACPFIVQSVLEKVPGVKAVRVDYRSRTATVLFDDAVSTIDDLTAATAAYGYPSQPRG